MIRRVLLVLVRVAARAARRVSLVLGRAEWALMRPEAAARASRAELGAAMAAHDMVDDPDEAYYRDRYWEWIEPRLPASGVVLDAGCGSGRLSVPVARRGLRVVGVDFLGESIERARRHASQAGVADVEFVEADLLEYLRRRPDDSFDAALFIEAGFVIPQLEDTLRELARVLKPASLLLASLRTQWYLALYAARERDWATAELVMSERGGALPGLGWQNWHTRADLADLLERTGFTVTACQGIGPASGIEGDPMDQIARPSQLSQADREGLARLENALGAAQPDAGRYVLFEARA
ncbi:MAG: class I SAM-dependent methyltransferase [Thermoleophilaceae bacterium]